ncbi:hypothetical protein [Frigoribacterium sp. VKM Ac-2530]|uniref:hypothetical protein n=1 Tax=Frigoribacterium sp. VKM Ac-2530 TaxID=2783822 RepID=UPI00188A33FE|nr:hypothetical protein [Frigoribacterium sp. VKM Ac-2530]MBF4578416.1 hypothetical protein [Frigoribacterium sp. VKM Ac-2530]
MTTTLLPRPRPSTAVDAVETHLEEARLAGAHVAAGHLVVLEDRVELTCRAALGVVLLACGTGCSAELVTVHVAAGIAMGNRVVLTFVETPEDEVADLVTSWEEAAPRGVFQAVATPGEAWHLRPGDVLTVAVLMPTALIVDDRRHQHVRCSDGRHDLPSALRLLSAPTTTTVPITVSPWRP